MILNVEGGPTPDKPTVTLSVPDPNHINSFMNFRVADIQACYELWKCRGAEFITEPIPKYGETRCYIRDPDGYIIEVGQSTDLTYVNARSGWSVFLEISWIANVSSLPDPIRNTQLGCS
jgi:hypothetical protein